MRTNLDPQEYFQKALSTYREGNAKEAEKMFRKLLKSFPNNDAVLNVLGVILIDKRPIDATHMLKKSVKANPLNIDAWINLSSVQKNRGHLKEAIESIQKAREIDPDRADIAYNTGNIYIAMGSVRWSPMKAIERLYLWRESVKGMLTRSMRRIWLTY